MVRVMGMQTPSRIWLRPPSWSNAAVEAIELYRSLGRRSDPWQCNTLNTWLGEDEDGLWATPECGLLTQRQNGKGGTTEPPELAGLLLWGERVIVHTAHRQETSRTAFKRILELVEGSDEVMRRVKAVNKATSEEAIVLNDGAELRFRTRTGVGARGITGDRVTLDEGQELTDEQLDAIVPIILARPNPQIMYTGTMPKHSTQFLMRLRKRAMAGAPGLAYCEWGVGRGENYDDPAVIARANPAYGIRVSPRTLAVARGVLGQEGYERECMGVPPTSAEDEWLVIPEEWWTAARDPRAEMTGRPAYGVYVNPDRSYAAIVAAGRRVGGGRLIEVTSNARNATADNPEGIDHRPGTGWIVPRLKELETHRPLVVVIDDKATADAAETAGIAVHRPSAGDVVTGCQHFWDGIAGPDERLRNVRHLEQEVLTTAAKGATTRPVGGSWAWERSNPLVDIAPLAAGSLALVGLMTERLHRPSRVPMVAFA